MSSSDRASRRARNGFGSSFLLAGALIGLAFAAGCTVQPLYGEVTSATSPLGGPVAELASVEIKPEDNRVGQEVRNHLIFLLAGGRGQPSQPAYSLALATSALKSSATAVSTRRVNLEPTAGIVTVRSTYTLTDARTGKLVSRGVRSVQAPFDIPSQEFAALRAVRDAENRAARELAELLRLVVAQELRQATSTTVPEIVSSPEELEDVAEDWNTDGLPTR